MFRWLRQAQSPTTGEYLHSRKSINNESSLTWAWVFQLESASLLDHFEPEDVVETFKWRNSSYINRDFENNCKLRFYVKI
jgi:hypothetical protein